ncbi:hypothetical protein R3P38DRAFT_312561 [Favolaschia claudopus]|uniref:Uncharacterized protein n=1 Tax=Favolaschia claudopus TaxID=2862362 RepID=A0AAW0CQJ9_9AGAR
MGYYPQSQAQAQVQQMEAYRSRSSSISVDPRMQPPQAQVKEQQVVAMEFAMPFAGNGVSQAAVDGGQQQHGVPAHHGEYRRTFAEVQQQQQGYATEQPMYDMPPPPRAYEDAYGSAQSPFGTAGSSGSGSGGSPYATTGPGPGPPPFGQQQQIPSPPGYAGTPVQQQQQQQAQQHQQQYYAGVYDAPQGQFEMVGVGSANSYHVIL